MVDFRINWTLLIGEVRKHRLSEMEKIWVMTSVGAVSNRTASACPDSRDPDAVPPVPIYRGAFRYIGTCRDWKQRLPNTEGESVYLFLDLTINPTIIATMIDS